MAPVLVLLYPLQFQTHCNVYTRRQDRTGEETAYCKTCATKHQWVRQDAEIVLRPRHLISILAMHSAARHVSRRVPQAPRAGPSAARLLNSSSQSNYPGRFDGASTSNAPKRHLSKSSAPKATEVRPHPAPAFQAPPAYPPLSPVKTKEVLDSSFVGMSGGKIFEEMMLRHGVKQIFGYPGEFSLQVREATLRS